jgi:uncharacterized protein GlcG (DUF336 family)
MMAAGQRTRAMRGCLVALGLFGLSSCGGGGGGEAACTSNCVPPPSVTDFLTVEDVQRIIAQAAFEASARRSPATIAVADRVGNILGVFRMAGARETFRITSGREGRPGATGGLENIDILPDTFAAISKAVTGAYLSSNGNAFSTRTANQIVQENFNPRENNQPSGPLFGVQFSQLLCSDLINGSGLGAAVPASATSPARVATSTGPKASPLGLSADPGGLPLYKNGRLVGGIGVIADGIYGIDPDIGDVDQDVDELIAVAATAGFNAPEDIRANRITADGRTFRYLDSEALQSNPAQAPAFATVAGSLQTVGAFTAGAIKAGVSFGNAASGYRADTGAFSAQGAFVLVDSGNINRYAPRAGTDGLLSATDATAILAEALKVANRARAQIRRPTGVQAQVTVSVVDTSGEVLAIARTPDAPVFGTDVSLQKARAALLFSHPAAAAEIAALPVPGYIGAGGKEVKIFRTFPDYVAAIKSFLGDPNALTGNVAYSNRAIGNLARPYFPDGLFNTAPGPLSTPISNWSPFHVGFQLDLNYNAIVRAALGGTDVGCTGLSRAKNGIQIFPGSVPIYRGNTLVGAIGVSGDGVDQDDMIAFLGLANAGRALNNGIGNAPKNLRADNIEPQGAGTRLRYVQCPQAPFIDSSEQNACQGL